MTEHLISHPARLQPCPHCGHYTLTAIAGGLTVHANPQALSINEEIAALITGKASYDVLIHGLPRGIYLERRDIDRIRAPRAHAVVATHICPVLFNPSPQPAVDIGLPYATAPQPDYPPF